MEMATDASGSVLIAAMQSPPMMVSKGSTRSAPPPLAVPFGATDFAIDLTIPRDMAPILSRRSRGVNGKSERSQSIRESCS